MYKPSLFLITYIETSLEDDIKRVGFVYLFRVIEDLDFKLAEIKDMPTLLKCLNEQIKKMVDGSKGYFDAKGNLLFEPYNIFITNNKGKLTPIKKISQIYEIVRSFPRRKKVYFNIKPYFDVSAQDKEKLKKEKVLVSKEVVSQLRIKEGDGGKFDSESSLLSEQNFLDTLDTLNQDRIKEIKKLCPGAKTDREIYLMLQEADGDVDTVLDKLFE